MISGVSGSGWYPAAGTYLLTKTPSASAPIKEHFITNSCITNLAYNSGTKKISFTATGNEGVAKISLDEGVGDCIWTWLIWCTDPPKTITYNAPADPNNSFTVMDRNLGATMSSGSELTSNDDIPKLCGLYYQWGRPVPLSPDYEPRNFTAARVSADQWTTSMEQSFKDADRYICNSSYDMYCYLGGFGDPWRHSGLFWGNNVYDMTYWRTVANIQKTIYDPCPPGYQVAPPDFMRDFDDTASYSQLSGDLHGIWLSGTGGSVFFPYAGRCNQNGMADRWKRGRFIGIDGGDDYNDGSWAVMWTSGSTAASGQACWFWEIAYRNDGRGSYGGTRSNTDINDGNMKGAYAASVRCVVDH